ncbi:MAG TPA: ribonuclease D [Gemmatimonadales bacterium]|nr:ribonuclease D [Gemmatimonadales bacterium]
MSGAKDGSADQVHLIATDKALAAWLAKAKDVTLLAIDTEAASFHRYEDKVYLVQLSTREATAVVDPLAVKSLDAVGDLLADPAVESVFHDADYDLRLLARQFGYRATSLFDTRVAAQLLNEPGIGLAALLEKYLHVTLDKRFQRADWSARPLSEDMLRYAASDTRFLPALRDIMRDALIAKGRLHWAEEEFALLAEVRWSDDDEAEPGWLRFKGAKALKPRPLAILRALYTWRDETAQALDRAPFRIINNEPMMTLAKDPPADLEALAKVKGVGRELVAKRGAEIMAAIRQAQAIPDAELPRRERPPRRPVDLAYEARVDQLKAMRNAEAERVGLAPGVLCPNGTLEGIARREPKTTEELLEVPGIRRWQVEVLGSRLLSKAPG